MSCESPKPPMGVPGLENSTQDTAALRSSKAGQLRQLVNSTIAADVRKRKTLTFRNHSPLPDGKLLPAPDHGGGPVSRHEVPMRKHPMFSTMFPSTRKQKGFSLIELLIVVAIILIIAAIAIPNLLRARMAANESSAVVSLKTIDTGMITYQSTYPAIGYAQALTNLGGVAPCVPSSNTACIIDSSLASGNKQGYTFNLVSSGGPPTVQYYVSAVPVVLNQTGVRSFCSFEDATIRVQPTGSGIPSEAACQALSPLQ